MTALLQATGLSAGYNGQPVVRDLDVEVQPGEVVALFGPNGAGKTTTLLTLAGELAPIAGEVMMDGKPAPSALHRRARNGLSFVTEERSVFMEMTVDENLRVARVDKARALELFPELEPLMNRRAGLLSGGEQQMLTLGRALARRPRLLLVDELSLGLAPLIVRRLLQALRTAADGGVGVLLVEQHVDQALKQADRVYVMERGLVILKGPKSEVADRVHEIEASYLGAAGGHKARPASAQ
jgi:ABC-type branched-subunit amino acid transport system ATPase component